MLQKKEFIQELGAQLIFAHPGNEHTGLQSAPVEVLIENNNIKRENLHIY